MFSETPRLPGIPVLGPILSFRRERLRFLERTIRHCGDFGHTVVLNTPIIVLSSAPLAHELLVDRAGDFIKSRGLSKFARPLLGNGLLTSEHELHRRQRKLMSPGFQHARIARYAGIMAEHGERMAARWGEGGTFDVAEEMMRLTLGIVAKALFDADVDGEASEIGEALTIGNRYVGGLLASIVQVPLSVPTRRNLQVRRAIARLDETIYRIIAERRASGADRGDVLSMLLAARDEDGQPMDDVQLRDEAMTVFLAGHETTANALAWCWELLARNPLVVAKLQAEVDAVLGERTPTIADLPQLPYTLRVFKEAMRLRPPAYLTARIAERDTEVGGHRIPKGSFVLVNIWGIHRRPDYFQDPDHFEPDRFTPENEKQLPRMAYLPFGGGPRICIGNHFALMEGQILLAQMARRFTFEHVRTKETVPETLITLRPKNGLPMRVRRRAPSA